jgi:hypothetical protein
MPTPPDERAEPPQSGDDRSLLTAFLDYHRQTLEWKCAGLSPAQLAIPGVPTTNMTLLGLIRHLTEVEMGWFQGFDGTEVRYPYSNAGDRDGDWRVGPAEQVSGADVTDAWLRWREAADASRRVVAATELDALSRRAGRPQVSMRWILLHLIEEYARHNGHADLIREAIDGAVGE